MIGLYSQAIYYATSPEEQQDKMQGGRLLLCTLCGALLC
jgi:hypothetical protein